MAHRANSKQRAAKTRRRVSHSIIAHYREGIEQAGLTPRLPTAEDRVALLTRLKFGRRR